jgi:GxxExxY protein
MRNEVQGDARPLLYQDITQKILSAAFYVHNTLGKGLTEKVYENAIVQRLHGLGLRVAQQIPLPLYFQNKKVGDQIVDLLVEDRVIVELKAVRQLTKDHISQVLGYLKNTRYQVALLINFGDRVQFKRLIYTSQNK